MSYGYVMRDISDQFNAPVDILIKKVCTELRIEDPRSEHDKDDDGQNRDDGNEQIRDNEPVAQAPEQPVSPRTNQTKKKIQPRQNRQVLDEAENTAAET